MDYSANETQMQTTINENGIIIFFFLTVRERNVAIMIIGSFTAFCLTVILIVFPPPSSTDALTLLCSQTIYYFSVFQGCHPNNYNQCRVVLACSSALVAVANVSTASPGSKVSVAIFATQCLSVDWSVLRVTVTK